MQLRYPFKTNRRLPEPTTNLFRSWCVGSEYGQNGQHGQPSSLIPQTLLRTLLSLFVFCVGCSVLLAFVAVSLALAPSGKLFVFSLDCSSAGGRRRRILLLSGLRATSSGAEIGKEFFCFSSPLSFICFLSNSLSRLLLCSSRMFRVLSWIFSFVCEVSPSSCSFSSVALLQAWLCADLHRGLCAIHGTLYITSRLASSPLSHGCVYASLFMQFQV